MDLLRELLQHEDIARYLQTYPQTQWHRVITATMLYGISSLRALRSAGLFVDVLEEPVKGDVQLHTDSLIPSIKGKLTDVKKQIDQIDKFLEDVPQRQALESPVLQPKPTAASTQTHRSSSVPTRTKSEKRIQPKQAKTEDYGELIYPEWWPKETQGGSRPPKQPAKRTVKPKTCKAKVLTFAEPVKEARPAMKTTGTSTSLIQPPFRMNSQPRSSAKPLKLAAPQRRIESQTRDQVEVRFPEELEEAEREEGLDARPQVASSLSSSSAREPRLKWSLPSEDAQAEVEERKVSSKPKEIRTVKRQPIPGWAQDFSNVVKRSPLKSSLEFSSHSSDPHLKDSSSHRDPEASRKFDTSSTSSMSTYNPSDELKAFYRNEHEKIFMEPYHAKIKTLETREMNLEPGGQQPVSMSAQLYRNSGSSDYSEGERYKEEPLGSMDSFSRA